MTYRLLVLAGVEDELRRVRDRLLEHDAAWIEPRLRALRESLRVLASNPFIGRPAGAHRQLIIGKGAWGYIALYRVDEARRVVRVLAIRHQREAGFTR